MEVTFASRKLEKSFSDEKAMVREWGDKHAKRIRLRLDDIVGADNLEELRFVPQARAHELKGNRRWQIAVNTQHPYRLILEPAHEKIPLKEDGGLDWGRVTKVRILEVVDYH